MSLQNLLLQGFSNREIIDFQIEAHLQHTLQPLASDIIQGMLLKKEYPIKNFFPQSVFQYITIMKQPFFWSVKAHQNESSLLYFAYCFLPHFTGVQINLFQNLFRKVYQVPIEAKVLDIMHQQNTTKLSILRILFPVPACNSLLLRFRGHTQDQLTVTGLPGFPLQL